MALERNNILTLIGSGRYRSCILTTFSFDFYFFEMKAIKWLHSCGVRNINVFIDGHYYSELMKQTTGEEMQLTAGYSLYPVFQKTIFHPKIWMLFGEKEGLLIVGSGNLTNSGNGNNDEIWGAFHFDISFTEDASIFSAAWSYISMLSSTVKGHMNEKTNHWIVEHSKWVNELPKIKPFQFYPTVQKEHVAFLYNSIKSSIWEEIVKHIINEKVIAITCISPFYDSDGKALQELKSLCPSALINVVLDESGLIPSSMQNEKSFIFFSWNDVGVSNVQYPKSENGNSKLHGKIIHFKTKIGKEFCLFGSANISNEGLGILGRGNSNSEVSLFIQSDNGGLLNELGIKLKPDKSKKLSDFKSRASKSIFQTVINNNQFSIQLLSADLIYDELKIYSYGKNSEKVKVVFFDKMNRFLNSQKPVDYKEEITIKLNSEFNNIQYIQLADSKDKYISNKLLVSDYISLAKTHPNPKTEDIERIYNDIQNGELSRVLDLLHYVLIDETEKIEGTNISYSSKKNENKPDEKKEPEKIFDLSSYKPQEHLYFEKHLLFFSNVLRVLDVLKFINTKTHPINREADIRVDEQEKNLGTISGNDENEVKISHSLSHSLLQSEKRKLLNYLNNLYIQQQEILYGNLRDKAYKPTLTDLTKYLIAIELLFEYGGKTEKYDEQNAQYFFNYLPSFNNYENDNVKGCCLNITGDFLMIASKGFKEYKFDYTKKKVNELKSEALINTIVCLINNYWRDNELHYLYSMLLNALHYLGRRDIQDFDSNFNELKIKILNRISKLKHRIIGIEKNQKRFFDRVVPAYKRVVKRIVDKDFDTSAMEGQMIYKSPWGYCYVLSASTTNELTLIRPGFLWDDNMEDYLKYNANEKYSPLKLSKFICFSL